MCNRDCKVLICVDVQPDFVSSEGDLTVPRDPAELSVALARSFQPRFDRLREYVLGDPAMLDAIAGALTEPEPDLFHLSFARAPERPALSEVPSPSGETAIERLWPRHCVRGTDCRRR
jgi:nicotinamidase-related amidase